MSRHTSYARPEQIAELTRGQELPLAPIPDHTLQLILETVFEAWSYLLAEYPEIIYTGDEDEVSALLDARLNALVDKDRCLAMIVKGVSRGRETTSFDGKHLKKEPDLSIHLTRRGFSFPLVAECKLIDKSSGKTVSLYCAKGLARFVAGEYAWATREAFMLAYVRDKSDVDSYLVPFLVASQHETPDPYGTSTLSTKRGTRMSVAQSGHERGFAYIHDTDACPGAIKLWHLWLPA